MTTSNGVYTVVTVATFGIISPSLWVNYGHLRGGFEHGTMNLQPGLGQPDVGFTSVSCHLDML